MSSDTVTINDIEFDAEDALAALDDALDDDTGKTYDNVGVGGTVVAVGDGDNDAFVRLANLSDVSRIDAPTIETESGSDDYVFDTVRSIRGLIEERQQDSFVEYLEGQSYIRGANEIEHVGGNNATVSYEDDGYLYMTGSEMRGIAGDENVEFSKVEGGKLVLTDLRE